MLMESSKLPAFLLLLLFLLPLLISAKPSISDLHSPYLSPSLFLSNYQKMLQNFKIFIYQSESEQAFNTTVESLFHSSLLRTQSLLTTNPEEAHLFYLSFPLKSTPRSVSRFIQNLRTQFPFWNRTLGADHFYVSSLGYYSDRNLVELKKNSIQISPFPCVIVGEFIPHKDLTLPRYSISEQQIDHMFGSDDLTTVKTFLGYLVGGTDRVPEFGSNIVNQLKVDKDFLIESGSSSSSSSKFCLFFYGGDFSGFVDALRYGCVPVVISDRPIVDLPFMDLLRWSEIAVFVGAQGGAEGVKRSMEDTCAGEDYQRMRELGKTASRHLVWNSSPKPYDAFHTVLYQLWTRRHTIRYAAHSTESS